MQTSSWWYASEFGSQRARDRRSRRVRASERPSAHSQVLDDVPVRLQDPTVLDCRLVVANLPRTSRAKSERARERARQHVVTSSLRTWLKHFVNTLFCCLCVSGTSVIDAARWDVSPPSLPGRWWSCVVGVNATWWTVPNSQPMVSLSIPYTQWSMVQGKVYETPPVRGEIVKLL